MNFEYTLVAHKIFHENIEAPNLEEARKQILQKYYPLKDQGYIILDSDLEFDNTIEYDTENI